MLLAALDSSLRAVLAMPKWALQEAAAAARRVGLCPVPPSTEAPATLNIVNGSLRCSDSLGVSQRSVEPEVLQCPDMGRSLLVSSCTARGPQKQSQAASGEAAVWRMECSDGPEALTFRSGSRTGAGPELECDRIATDALRSPPSADRGANSAA